MEISTNGKMMFRNGAMRQARSGVQQVQNGKLRAIGTTLAAALLLACLPVAARADGGEVPAGQTKQTVAGYLSLTDTLNLAEANNQNLRLAQYQLSSARDGLVTAPANAATLAPAATLYARVQLGIEIPESAISPEAAARQAQVTYEQAAAQYWQARQQVRLGALQAYVEWQRASALVTAQRSALDRARTQEAQARAAFDLGAVARLDLLQAQAQVAGQQAALEGALAMEGSVRVALEQVIGRALAPGIVPASPLPRAADVTLSEDVDELTDRALANRADLRRARLELTSRRLAAGLAGGTNSGPALLQLQVAAAQYEAAVSKARAEVEQALLGARGAVGELKAREAALEPAGEALRLAELRYQAGLATYAEVQAASASALQAEAARIQAAATVTLNLAKLAQATGEL